ncbi:class I SAM-dependent methyltransferase [Candidatus Woesearchaeota archaeon]|nr:class I SAM-dependent methyltransferase [Candidatus Woesearchaeota archaeon]
MIQKWADFYKNTASLKDFLGNYYSYELFEEIIKHSPKRILEVGTGTGVMSILLSHLGYQTTAIDNDQKVLDNAKKNSEKFNGKVKFEKADTFKLPYSDKSFDVTFSQGLIEHFSNADIEKMLKEQMRVSKKAVVVSVPNNYYSIKEVGNERLLTGKSWENLLKRLTGKKVYSFDYQYFLRKNMPFLTIWNLVRNKKVLTVVTILVD